MAETWRGTTYTESAPDSPEEFIDGLNSYATRILDVTAQAKGSLKVQSVVDFLGDHSTASDGLNLWIQRRNPMPHPDWTWLYATTCGVKGQGFDAANSPGNGDMVPPPSGPVFLPPADPLRIARFKQYQFTLTFRAKPYDICEDSQVMVGGVPDESTLRRYVSFEAKPAVEALPIPAGCLLLVSAPTVNARKQVVPAAISKLFPSSDLRIKWWFVPEDAVPALIINPTLATPAIDTMLGTVNSVEFAGQGPGMLLLTAAMLYPDRQANGGRVWHIEYAFKFIPPLPGMDATIGSHNTLLYKSNVPNIGWSEASFDGGHHALTVPQQHLYDAADHKALFRPGA